MRKLLDKNHRRFECKIRTAFNHYYPGKLLKNDDGLGYVYIT